MPNGVAISCEESTPLVLRRIVRIVVMVYIHIVNLPVLIPADLVVVVSIKCLKGYRSQRGYKLESD